jgi:myo-inositol-1(or 4)-monophosphatase
MYCCFLWSKDEDAMREIILQAARDGGRILMQKFGSALTVRHKGEVDLVTEADRLAESAIVSVIRGTFPRHDILAEEEDYGRSNSQYRWIIDPLDGTKNYAHGLPWFAVSIALEVAGEVTAGVVYNPFHQELFYAEKGRGAYLNEVALHVSKTTRLDLSLLATGFPYDRKESPINNLDHFFNFQTTAQGCRRIGSASLDLAYVAAGRLDGYWEMKLKPWDVAAGKLIVEEAGGRVSDFVGNGLDIYGKEILASNGPIHAEMVKILAKGARP